MPYRLLLSALLLATTCLYWQALDGPFLLDDFSIVPLIEAWHGGERSWQETLLINRDSLLNSRPVAMATMMASTALGGVGVFPLKLGNLLIHLFCGLAGWWLLRRCLRLDGRLSRYADALALVAAAVWLFHPLHVSTVLYVVQRMAQLSALFTLASVAAYLVGRAHLRDGRTRAALLTLFVAFPLLLMVGILSKQNAAAAPLLCLVLELAYFQRNPGERAPLAGFFGAFLLLPACALLVMLAASPGHLLGGYAEYDFTAWERLITQPRAILDYIGLWFLPNGPRMGLYTDDFAASAGLLSPATTLPAVGGLLGISIGAIIVRKRAPSVFAGWFLFLAAHSIESSFLPLELYYEHRNYLPSIGLLLASLGLLALLPEGALERWRSTNRRAAVLLAPAGLAVLAVVALGRVLVWSDLHTIVLQGLRTHPHSLRANTDAMVMHLRAARYPEALLIADRLSRDTSPGHRLVGHLNKVAIDCLSSGTMDREDLDAAARDAPRRLSVVQITPIRLIVNVTGIRDCGDQNVRAVADALSALLEAAVDQPDTAPSKVTIRSLTAQMYARSGDWSAAESHARIAWTVGGHLPSSSLLIRALIRNDKLDEAARTLAMLDSELRPFDTAGQREAQVLRTMLEDKTALRVGPGSIN